MEDEMKQLVFQRRAALTAVLVVFIGGCAANLAAPRGVKDPSTGPRQSQADLDVARTSNPAQSDTAATAGASGFVVHIDPTTGEFLPEPPPDGITPLGAEAAKAPAPQFRAVPSPVLGGGVMVDLQGQFQTPLVATIDADGKLTVKHESRMTATGAEHK
jgi:hypothetical protein